ncbi:methionine sulfoxide reductase B9 [Arabidopsis thaliana]|uniref:Isoform 2 of Peptide methionine sulfoxide reductase B9 n=1 Tax=Arabidopsis thaliana TaxID=3702 RepID=Q84JT6-2|nr:methionine sulfoxide reductase B9 [Arabidopsis thaliana]AEE84511.1 methionine sulfoxide reductase B9 [Arabidopsis thaliana]|eukprot:NP_849418.1 methionine sulfoxide reductase B9 [Arabidopsis thaliana]
MPTSATAVAPSTGSVQKKDQDWRAILSPEQFRVLREKGTENRGKGEYTKLFDDGIYSCAGCATPLYKSTTKFDSGCGWPSFFDAIPGAIKQTVIDIFFFFSFMTHNYFSDKDCCIKQVLCL